MKNREKTVLGNAVAEPLRTRDSFSYQEIANEHGNHQLSHYVDVIWRHRWPALACILLTFLYVLIGSVKETPVFLAKGSLEIELPQSSLPNAESLFQVQPAPDTYLQTQVQILSSDVLTSRVLDQLFPAIRLQDPLRIASLEADLHKNLKVELVRGTRLIQIELEDTDPQRAAETVNTVMSQYIEGIRVDHSDVAQNATSWIVDQLKETKAKLEQATTNLQAFQQDHPTLRASMDVSNNEKGDDFDAELARATSTRIERQSVYEQAQSGDSRAIQSPLLAKLLDSEASLQQQLSQLSTKYGPNFPRVRQVSDALDETRENLKRERERAREALAAEYGAAERRENLTKQEVAQQQKLVNDTAQQILRADILKREVDLNRKLYDNLLERFGQAGATSKLVNTNARVVDAAKAPTAPIRPRIARNLSLSLAVGLTLGICLALVLEHWQVTFTTGVDLESFLNIPLLAIIPAVAIKRTPSPHNIESLAANFKARGPLRNPGRRRNDGWFRLDRDGGDCFEMSEAIRNLRTSLLFSADANQPRSILISSAVPAEGKTTISCNLSIALAQLGKKVLLIDADLRRPRVHAYFSLKNEVGLSTHLLGSSDWHSVAHASGVPRLDVIASGKIPADPIELLSMERMRELITLANAEYDFVMVDSPTLINMADSRVLASYVDGVILIVKSGSTPRSLVQEAYNNLRGVSAEIIGVVLNQLDRDNERYSYGNSYYADKDLPRVVKAAAPGGNVEVQ